MAAGKTGKTIAHTKVVQARPASFDSFTISLVEEGGVPVLLHKLLAGDVWVCSGQSDMEFSVAAMFGAAEVISDAAHEGLRPLRPLHDQ